MAITSLPATSSSPSSSNDMDTEVDQSNATHNPTPNSPDLSAIINELKQEIAAFVRETREVLQRPLQVSNPFEGFKLSPMPT